MFVFCPAETVFLSRRNGGNSRNYNSTVCCILIMYVLAHSKVSAISAISAGQKINIVHLYHVDV